MKKLFITILSISLILILCACGNNTTKNQDIPSQDLNDLSEEIEESIEEISDEISDTTFTENSMSYEGSFEAYSVARDAFDDYVSEKISEHEIAMYGHMKVTMPEIEVFDLMLPLHLWGETLDDEELELKEFALSAFTIQKSLISVDLQKENDNKYFMSIEKENGDQYLIQIEYQPHIDALRLVAENNGNLELIFEYANTGDGYAVQFYFNSVIGAGNYGEAQIKAMCVNRIIFSGKDGSYARFEDVKEPTSLLVEIPNEKEFIEGATEWLTIKDNKFTGELGGEAF